MLEAPPVPPNGGGRAYVTGESPVQREGCLPHIARVPAEALERALVNWGPVLESSLA